MGASLTKKAISVADRLATIVGLKHWTDRLWKTEHNTGWKDLTAFVGAAAPSPSNQPTLTNFGAAGTMQRQEYAFADGDYVFLNPFHVNHDINKGARAFLHVHWSTSGTAAGTVTWRLHVQKAKGHNQEAFGTPYYIELTAPTAGVAWQHMVTEVNGEGVTTTTSNGSDPIIYLDEPDTLYLVTLEKVTDTVADTVFAHMVDFHYESSREVTPNRVPNFYGS